MLRYMQLVSGFVFVTMNAIQLFTNRMGTFVKAYQSNAGSIVGDVHVALKDGSPAKPIEKPEPEAK